VTVYGGIRWAVSYPTGISRTRPASSIAENSGSDAPQAGFATGGMLSRHQMTARSNVQASFEHECQCGNKLQGTIDWPEDTKVNGAITLANSKCSRCHEPVVLPTVRYFVENF
jgi:hypothetical protein